MSFSVSCYHVMCETHSKRYPVVDLDTRVYLRSNITKSFWPTRLSHTPFLFPPQHYVHDILIFLPSREATASSARSGRKSHQSLLCSYSELPVSGVVDKVHGHPLTLLSASMQISNLHDLSFIQDLKLLRQFLLFKNPLFSHQLLRTCFAQFQ